MLKDLKFAVRLLGRSKGWTSMVVLSLALGIGANTALFSAVNALAFRTLPVDDPHSLVRLRHIGRNEMSQNVSEYGPIVRSGRPRRDDVFVPDISRVARRQPNPRRPRCRRHRFSGQRGRRRQR